MLRDLYAGHLFDAVEMATRRARNSRERQRVTLLTEPVAGKPWARFRVYAYECNGVCVYASELLECAPAGVAYPHPDCDAHSRPAPRKVAEPCS
jgi:hypothetical protein